MTEREAYILNLSRFYGDYRRKLAMFCPFPAAAQEWVPFPSLDELLRLMPNIPPESDWKRFLEWEHRWVDIVWRWVVSRLDPVQIFQLDVMGALRPLYGSDGFWQLIDRCGLRAD